MVAELFLWIAYVACVFSVVTLICGVITVLALHYAWPQSRRKKGSFLMSLVSLYDNLASQFKALFVRLGISRDSGKLFWTQIVAGASFVLTGAFNVHQFAVDYFAYNLSTMQIRWFMGICFAITWLAGRLASSPLPGRDEMPKDPPAGVPVVKTIASLLIIGMLGMPFTAGCIAKPPAGTYDAATQRQYYANEVFKDLDSVVQTAKDMNAATGRLHLSDLDTKITLDSVKAVEVAVKSYVDGASTPQAVRDAYNAFIWNLTIDAKQHPKLAPVLASISAAINVLPL